jgi:hypothetical protein
MKFFKKRRELLSLSLELESMHLFRTWALILMNLRYLSPQLQSFGDKMESILMTDKSNKTKNRRLIKAWKECTGIYVPRDTNIMEIFQQAATKELNEHDFFSVKRFWLNRFGDVLAVPWRACVEELGMFLHLSSSNAQAALVRTLLDMEYISQRLANDEEDCNKLLMSRVMLDYCWELLCEKWRVSWWDKSKLQKIDVELSITDDRILLDFTKAPGLVQFKPFRQATVPVFPVFAEDITPWILKFAVGLESCGLEVNYNAFSNQFWKTLTDDPTRFWLMLPDLAIDNYLIFFLSPSFTLDIVLMSLWATSGLLKIPFDVVVCDQKLFDWPRAVSELGRFYDIPRIYHLMEMEERKLFTAQNCFKKLYVALETRVDFLNVVGVKEAFKKSQKIIQNLGLENHEQRLSDAEMSRLLSSTHKNPSFGVNVDMEWKIVDDRSLNHLKHSMVLSNQNRHLVMEMSDPQDQD